MGRQFRDKLPRCKIPNEESRLTEFEVQGMLKDRDAFAKLRQKEYADKVRHAENSRVSVGDQVLLHQHKKTNKLATNFEPIPYTVLSKTGNAVLIEGENGVVKMRNAGHMKPLVVPESPRRFSSDSEVTTEASPSENSESVLVHADVSRSPNKPLLSTPNKPSKPDIPDFKSPAKSPGSIGSASSDSVNVHQDPSPSNTMPTDNVRPSRTRMLPKWLAKDYVLK